MKTMWVAGIALMIVLTGCTSDASQEEDPKEDPSTNVEDTEKSKESENVDTQEEKDQEKESNDQKEESEEQTSDKKDDSQKSESDNNKEQSTENTKPTKQIPADLTEQEAKAVVVEYKRAFFDVINNTDDQLKIQDYTSLQAIEREFRTAMSEPLADELMSYYIRQENGTLYVVPSSAPTFLEASQPVTVERIDDRTYHVAQTRSDEMAGSTKITYKLIHDGTQWVVDEIKNKQLNQEASSANQTGEQQAVLAVRDYLNINSSDSVKVEVDHEESGKYLVHVYELVEQEGNSHTATKGWYYVDQKTGKVTDMMNP